MTCLCILLFFINIQNILRLKCKCFGTLLLYFSNATYFEICSEFLSVNVWYTSNYTHVFIIWLKSIRTILFRYRYCTIFGFYILYVRSVCIFSLFILLNVTFYFSNIIPFISLHPILNLLRYPMADKWLFVLILFSSSC